MSLTIDWREVGTRDGSSPAEVSFNEGRQTAQRSIKIRWEDQEQALREILGYSQIKAGAVVVGGGGAVLRNDQGANPVDVPGIGDPPGIFLSRVLPEFHPIHTHMWAVDATVRRGMKWLSVDDQFDVNYRNRFKYAILDITYQAVQWNNLADDDVRLNNSEKNRNTEYWEEFSFGSITLPGGTMIWEAGAPAPFPGKPVVVGVSKIEGHKSLHIKWREIPYAYLPYSAIQDTVGRVNKFDFTYDNRTYPAGTLLCMPPKTTYRWQANGAFVVDIEYVLDYFKPTHNKILLNTNNAAVGYYQINRANVATTFNPGAIPDGRCLYDEISFEPLFQVA